VRDVAGKGITPSPARRVGFLPSTTSSPHPSSSSASGSCRWRFLVSSCERWPSPLGKIPHLKSLLRDAYSFRALASAVYGFYACPAPRAVASLMRCCMLGLYNVNSGYQSHLNLFSKHIYTLISDQSMISVRDSIVRLFLGTLL
jgi:hypothetical protein